MRYIIFILLFLTLATNFTLADGCYVPKIAPGAYAQDITEPTQKAIIAHAEGKERMILQVSFRGKVSEFVWLVPTPSVPKVTTKEYAPKLFEELHSETAPQIRFWFNSERCFHSGFAGRSAPKVAEPDVDVLEKKVVGIYDVAVLRAKKADDLIKWLRENNYHVTPKIASTLSYYTQKDWIFTASKINTANKKNAKAIIKEGKLDALIFDFKTKQPVYPLRISSINPSKTKILLYVATFHRVSARPFKTKYAMNWDGSTHGAMDKFFDGSKMEDIYFSDPEAWYLTKLSATLTPKQMTHDLILKRAKTDAIIPVKYVSPPFMENLGALSLAIPICIYGLLFIPIWLPGVSFVLCAVCGVIALTRRNKRSKYKWIAAAASMIFFPALLSSIDSRWSFLFDLTYGPSILAHDMGEKTGYWPAGVVTILLIAFHVFRLCKYIRRKKKINVSQQGG